MVKESVPSTKIGERTIEGCLEASRIDKADSCTIRIVCDWLVPGRVRGMIDELGNGTSGTAFLVILIPGEHSMPPIVRKKTLDTIERAYVIPKLKINILL